MKANCSCKHFWHHLKINKSLFYAVNLSSSIFCQMAGFWQSHLWAVSSFLSAVPLLKAMQSLVVASLSILVYALLSSLVVLPNIQPSIVSGNSESRLKTCPIHLSLRCALSKIFLFSCTFLSSYSVSTLSAQRVVCSICSVQFSDGYFSRFLWWFQWLLMLFEYCVLCFMINFM